jgi:excisionase family DNA binding protein
LPKSVALQKGGVKMEKRYLGIEEASSYLGLTKGSLYVWCCQKRIPYLKVGKLLKFDIIEIEKWLQDKRVKELS